jgi:hypothetical protein
MLRKFEVGQSLKHGYDLTIIIYKEAKWYQIMATQTSHWLGGDELEPPRKEHYLLKFNFQKGKGILRI